MTKTGRFLIAALVAAGPAFAASSDFRWSGAVASGRTVEIRNINGAIHAEPSNSGTLEVVATRYSKKQDPESVRIEVLEGEGGRIIFCTLYPSQPGKPENKCDEHGQTSHNSKSDVTVDYRVKVPAGVELRALTVNGNVKASAMKGPVDARTVNGEIRVTTSSWAQATTVNGGVAVEMASKGWPDDLEFRTVNGSIVLDLVGAPNAALRAETMHGDIDSDFPFEVSGKIRRNSIRGTLGAGGKELALTTLNGSIELRKAR